MNGFALTCVFFSRVQIAFDEATDEFSAYFNGLTNPKVLITTSDRPRGVSGCLVEFASWHSVVVNVFKLLHLLAYLTSV